MDHQEERPDAGLEGVSDSGPRMETQDRATLFCQSCRSAQIAALVGTGGVPLGLGRTSPTILFSPEK
jgi:hypothetical protein